jgi:tetratricopeptide (TPR) repeat protein
VSINTLWNGLVWDDLILVGENPWIRHPGRLGEAFTTHVVGFSKLLSPTFYRPLVHVAYGAVYAFTGIQPWGYHLLNALLHVTTSVLVYLVAARSTSGRAATLGALVFAVHPIHSEAVAWVAGIFDLAFAAFSLLTLWTITDERRWIRLSAPVPFAVALLWKEPAVAVVPIAALYLAARAEVRARSRELGALAAVLAAYFVIRMTALGGIAGTDHNSIYLSPSEAALTSLALVYEYARKLVIPTGLSPVHQIPVAVHFGDPRAVAGAVIVVGIALGAWYARRRPDVILALGLLAIPLLPVLYTPALKDTLFAERYLYLPSAGASLLVAAALAAWPNRTLQVALAPVLVVFFVASFERHAIWRDGITLWRDTVAKVPTSAVAWETLGSAYALEERYREAVEPLSRALALDPKRIDARLNLAISLGKTGRREEAIPHALAAVAQCPSCAATREALEALSE